MLYEGFGKMGIPEKSQAQNVRDLIVVAVVAAVFSSFTLWLIDSWIKYPLFLFEIATIIVLYSIISDYPVKLTMKQIRTGSINGGLAIDACFMVSALILLVINAAGIQAGLFQLVLTFLCTSLLSGYALLNIVGMSAFFSKLESLVISYIVSFLTSGILFLFLLPLNELTRPVIACVFFLILGFLSMVKHLKQPKTTLRKSLIKPVDALPLAIALLFYVIAFFLMYPNYALLAGTDISAVFSETVVLNRTPNLYSSFNYFFYELFGACLYSLSTPSLASFQSSLQILNWISPLVFYMMAKEHLESIDKRLPSVATVFWVLFSNLGWLYYVKLKLTSNVQSQLQLLSITTDKTILGPALASFGLEYTPVVVSITLLLILIYLLKRLDIPTAKYVALFSIITAAMYLTHPVEVTVFALFLALYGVLSKGESLRVNDSLKASLLGFLMAGAVYTVLSTITVHFTLDLSTLLSLIVPILLLSLALCLRRLTVPLIQRLKKVSLPKISWTKVLIVCLLFLYVLGFLTWASSADSFNLSPYGFVPLYFYPIMLGASGLLSLLALFYVIGDKQYSKLVFFVALVLFIFAAGRTVSFVNANFFDTNYWEYRFLILAGIATSILAPIAIVKFASKWNGSSRSLRKTLGTCLLISVITLAGVSTCFLGLEYWHDVSNNPALLPSSQEFDALDYMKSVFDADPSAWLVTATTMSYQTDQFAAAADQMLSGIPVLFTAENPEVPLYMLYRSPYLSHPYLYVDSRDETYIQQNYQDGYVAQNLIPMLPTVFANQEVTVYNISQVAPPTPGSNTALVVPFDESAISGKPYLYAYNLLSQGLYNYTVNYDLDDKLMQKNTLVLSYDPPSQNVAATSFNEDSNNPENGWTQNSGLWSAEQGQLVGGLQGYYTSGNILSPVSPENFTATFEVTPLGGNANTPTYARLLYSWSDAEDYRSADVLFNNDGLIYVYFSDVSNGTLTATFPIINTGIKWAFNEEHEVKVNVNGNTDSIYIDNNLLCTANMENVKGTVGLNYEGNISMAFSQFQLAGTSTTALRDLNDYTNYVQSGGTLVVLNTNGYGNFAESLFSPSNSTLDAEAIKTSNETLELPADVEAPILNLKINDAEILSNYTSALGENTVYAVREPLGNGQLFYVNLYPLINHMESEGDQPSFYTLFGKLLTVAGLDLDKCKLSALPASVSTFQTAELNGEVQAETDSILFPLQVNITTVEVTANGQPATFNDVTSLSLKNYEKITVQTGSISISQGNGLYADLTLNETTQLTPASNDTLLTLSANNEEFEVSNLTDISLVPEKPLEIYAYTPSINSSGNASLTDVTIPGSLKGRQISGQDLKITGILTFDTYLSDSYTLAENLNIDGSFNTSPPIAAYDEWSVPPITALWSLILLPIFIVPLIVLYCLKRIRASRKLRNASNTQ
jgi:hypothetical protein